MSSGSSSTCTDVAVVTSEQLCYIHCNFCNIVLAVSVPCNSLFDTVTVRCGNCTNMWPVNVGMAAAFHQSLSGSTSTFQVASSSHHQQGPNHIAPNYRVNLGFSQDCNKKMPMAMRPRPPTVTNAQEINNRPPEKRQRVPSLYNRFIKVNLGFSQDCNKKMPMAMRPRPPTVTNAQEINDRPPEKRQRVPSLYNWFIKEEIQRIKANNPHISHKEAFSTAAKNWAHFPHIQFGLMLGKNNHQANLDEGLRFPANDKA